METPPRIQSIRLDGFLSFAPGSDPIELRALNVVIGPNGSGKSNLIEAFEFIRRLPTPHDFDAFMRQGGLVSDWIWKDTRCAKATVELVMMDEHDRRTRYAAGIANTGQNILGFVDESFETIPVAPDDVPFSYFHSDGNDIVVATKFIGPNGPAPDYAPHRLTRNHIRTVHSLIAQHHERDSYPDIRSLAERFASIETFREWRFGSNSPLRSAQHPSMPTDGLLPDQSNLAMMVQELQHQGTLDALYPYLKRFLPRFDRLSTRLSGASILLYMHEENVSSPTPATRMSDGTLRFIALLLLLLGPRRPGLICIDEPELGLHPDAVTILADVFVEVSAHTQLIVTTHSDALVSALTEQGDCVMVCEHREGTLLDRVDPEKLRHWLDRYRLGDLWRMGKLGGNP